MTETPDPADTQPSAPLDPTAAIRAMIAQWVSFSNAVAERTLGATAGVPPTIAETVQRLLGTAGLPSRDDVLAVGTAVAALDVRLARIEALLTAGADPTPSGTRSATATPRSSIMADLSHIKEHMNVIGADGVHVGTVDGIEGDRIKLTKDSSSHTDHHHYISGGLVADIEDNDVRLSANAAVAVTFEEEA